MSDQPKLITIHTTIDAPVAVVWKKWTHPEDIMRWNNASPDWHTPRAENDLRPGGTFLSRMEAKDGSMGFDFGGTYTRVVKHERIDYTIADGRTVSIVFTPENGKTRVTETFEAERVNDPELQRGGWQAILDNFRKYAES